MPDPTPADPTDPEAGALALAVAAADLGVAHLTMDQARHLADVVLFASQAHLAAERYRLQTLLAEILNPHHWQSSPGHCMTRRTRTVTQDQLARWQERGGVR